MVIDFSRLSEMKIHEPRDGGRGAMGERWGEAHHLLKEIFQNCKFRQRIPKINLKFFFIRAKLIIFLLISRPGKC